MAHLFGENLCANFMSRAKMLSVEKNIFQRIYMKVHQKRPGKAEIAVIRVPTEVGGIELGWLDMSRP